ncbi:MAG TPA: DUF3459 domain-containing protein [Rugosimonospora sp.]|nr:DUF3459 domain-containing protein [Rugosimonospora sp.]
MAQDLAVRVRPGNVCYELDVRTFTDDGSYLAAAEHLDHLVDLGVDVVELLPGPAEADSRLADFVDACHLRGMAVLLGLARPVTLAQLRQLFVRYGLDGVRAPGIGAAVVRQVAGLAQELGRPLVVLPAGERGRAGAHALHALFAGGPVDVEAGSPETLADVLHEVLLHAGGMARAGNRRPGTHDFVGTPHRPAADRALLRVGATLLLTGPFTPLVFMGEEWGATAGDLGHLPSRIGASLNPAPRLGAPPSGSWPPGSQSFGRHPRLGAPSLSAAPPPGSSASGSSASGASGSGSSGSGALPGSGLPLPGTRPAAAWSDRELAALGARRAPAPAVRAEHAGLDWAEAKEPGHAELLAFYQRLIALRRATADLADPRPERVRLWYGDQFIAMRRGDCGIVANLAPVMRRVSLDGYPRRVLLATEHGARIIREAVDLPPYSAIIVAYA